MNTQTAECESRPVALITGASRGIGAATARELARRGYALALAARSEDQLQALQRELQAVGVPVLVVRTDVRNRSELFALAGAVLERFGKLDVLLHNSGVLRPGILISELSDADVDDIVKTNLEAPVHLTRALLPSMIARGSGFIAFVDSVGGHIALPSAALYSATKFALRGFAGALRREVVSSGIRISIISPGFVTTELTAEIKRVFRGLHVPMSDPERVAKTIARVIAHPKREVVVPAYYRVFIWIENNIPAVMDFVANQYMKLIVPRFAEAASAGDTNRRERSPASPCEPRS